MSQVSGLDGFLGLLDLLNARLSILICAWVKNSGIKFTCGFWIVLITSP